MTNLKLIQLTIFLVTLSSFLKVESIKISRKLDDTNPDLGNKCGGCPCNNPCNPPPSPPPPSPPPPSPPPPKPKPTPTPDTNCPPPPLPPCGGGQYSTPCTGPLPPCGGGQYPTPCGGGPYLPNTPYIYVNGQPGNLYPIDYYYSGSGRIVVGFYPFLIASGVMLLAFG